MVAAYKRTETDIVIRASDGAHIPNDPANRDYAEFLAWVEAGGVADPYVPPPVDFAAYAADARWRSETGGIAVGSLQVPTDDRAKLLILGAAQMLGDADTAPFIANGVNYGNVSGAQFRAINAAITTHVQATFATLATVMTGISAGTITTTAAIDAAFAA
jgi:hypothetical protein